MRHLCPPARLPLLSAALCGLALALAAAGPALADAEGTEARAAEGGARPAASAEQAEPDAGAAVSSPPRWSPPPPSGPTTSLAAEFSGERAYRDLEQLVAIGPRVAGTPGAEAARDYIRAQLEAVGAEVIEYPATLQPSPEREPVSVVHLVGVLPGASSDVFLLAAPYDTFPIEEFEHVGANDGASGPALLLEMARALSAHDLGYTVWLAFVDGDSIPASRQPGLPSHAGSRDFAAQMQRAGDLERIRLGFFFNKVADPDLRIARDLRSHRTYREMVWQAAFDLDRVEAFPPDAPFESPHASHRSFIAERFPRVVALVDNRYGGDEEPGVYWHTADDDLEHTAPGSLGAVGSVALEALTRIERRLAKIDRFVSTRAAEPPAAPLPSD